MDLFRINIKDNGSSREDQIYDAIAEYMGDSELQEIADKVGCDILYRELGQLTTSDLWYDKETIHGILIFEDGMGDLIDGYYFSRDGRLVNMERIATKPYFEMAVKLNSLYHTIEPYNNEDTVTGCLDLMAKDPMYVIDGLINEVQEWMDRCDFLQNHKEI